VWPEPVKLPAEADPTKDQKVRGYEALTDASLLIRESAEKKRFLVGSKLVNVYDLSDKGRPAWTPDPNQPVTATSASATSTPPPSTRPSLTTLRPHAVHRHLPLRGGRHPDWARTPESMRAFPKIAADTSIQSATVILVKGADGGWAAGPQ